MSIEHKNSAVKSLNTARNLCLKGILYDTTAPYVMLAVLPFVKWEAEELPKLFRKWDNEVYHLKDLGNKVQRTRFGYKIGNAMGNDPELTRAMVVRIGFSYKRKKK